MSGRRLAVVLTGAAALAAAAPGPLVSPSHAAGPQVRVMVVGPGGKVLGGPRLVRASRTGVVSAGRRCTVGQGLALSALEALRRRRGPSYRLSGSCGQLYVEQIGRHRARGLSGWVYKVDRRLGTVGAADRRGPFGDGRRLRSGQRLLWYWCGRAGRCARTLELSSVRRARRGSVLRVRVRAYDDRGRGTPVAGALVRVGRAAARTGRDGLARLRLPRRRGLVRLTAGRRGTVPAFPRSVRVR